jgi:hypothetical protein
MSNLTDADARLSRTRRYAFAAWLAALSFGLLSWGARALDLPWLASMLLAGVWLSGAAFFICWAVLIVSAIVSLVNHLSGRNDGA